MDYEILRDNKGENLNAIANPVCPGANGVCPGVNGACPGVNGACPGVNGTCSKDTGCPSKNYSCSGGGTRICPVPSYSVPGSSK